MAGKKKGCHASDENPPQTNVQKIPHPVSWTVRFYANV